MANSEGSMTNHEGSMNGADGEIHTMDGVPTWMALAGVVLIIVVSHVMVMRSSNLPSSGKYRNFNLLAWRPLRALLGNSAFPLMAQSLSILLFFLIVSAGLFGSQRTNIAPVLTWTWWWILLIFMITGFGTAFCTICPWEGITSLVTSLSLRSRVKKLGFEKAWPRFARNLFPALILFIVLTWFELGYDITRSPSMTAVMAMVMVSMAVLCGLVFEKRAFCRYACLVGRISGLYALFSPMELRPRSTDVCRTCDSKACYHGTGTHTACPTGIFPAALTENVNCTLCTECVRSCPSDNLDIRLRPPATDLMHKTRFRWDEATLAIILLALTSFHGVTMTPSWYRVNDILRVELSLGPKMVFTLLMTLMIIAPVLLLWVTACIARVMVPNGAVPAGKILRAFAYAVIPVALFYHLAHNSMHFFMEAQNVLPLLSDPFGRGWDLFGTAGRHYGPLLSLQVIWFIQLGMIVVGHVYGVVIAARIARRLHPDAAQARRSLIPLLVTMVLYSAFSVWLVAQPMKMRSGM